MVIGDRESEFETQDRLGKVGMRERWGRVETDRQTDR